MKKAKVKKRVKENMVIEVSRRKMILLHVLFFVGIAVFISGFFVRADKIGLSFLLITVGLLMASCSVFSRDYYFRCPNCGRPLFKKQSFRNRAKGIPPVNCPDCHWHANVIYRP